MKAKILFISCLYFFSQLIASNALITASFGKNYAQSDTVLIIQTSNAPLIDGTGDDKCWQKAEWQSIDQVWIPYGTSIGADDYSGRYKVLWCPLDNLLYLLVEITDDIGIDGFIPGQTADIYNYDIVEVFIDEDRSGGLHAYEDENVKAANAFGYHIYSDFPVDGMVVTEKFVGDIPGYNWDNQTFTDHIPEYAITKSGSLYTREFSLMVFDDTYTGNNKEESRVWLEDKKIMGLSLAYCDNDENDGMRDSFFGSVWVSPEAYNDHWLNASDFGVAKIVTTDITAIAHNYNSNPYSLVVIFDGLNVNTNITYTIQKSDYISLSVYDITGKKINNLVNKYQEAGTYRLNMDMEGLPLGIYMFKLKVGKYYSKTKKIIVSG